MGFSTPRNLTGQGLGINPLPKKKTDPSLAQNTVFAILHYIKYAGGLPSGTVMGGTFRPEITGLYFGPARTWSDP